MTKPEMSPEEQILWVQKHTADFTGKSGYVLMYERLVDQARFCFGALYKSGVEALQFGDLAFGSDLNHDPRYVKT